MKNYVVEAFSNGDLKQLNTDIFNLANKVKYFTLPGYNSEDDDVEQFSSTTESIFHQIIEKLKHHYKFNSANDGQRTIDGLIRAYNTVTELRKNTDSNIISGVINNRYKSEIEYEFARMCEILFYGNIADIDGFQRFMALDVCIAQVGDDVVIITSGESENGVEKSKEELLNEMYSKIADYKNKERLFQDKDVPSVQYLYASFN